MASYGLLGALSGLGKGLAETGTAMQKDAYEKAREARLEDARIRMEQRAEIAEEARFKRGLLTEWGDTDISGGTRAAGNRMAFESVHGVGANHELGSRHYDDEAAYNLWNRQQEADVKFHGQKAKNTVAAAGKWELQNHPEVGWAKVNTETGDVVPLQPGTGSPHAKDSESSLKDSDMRAIYDRHRQRVIEGVAPAGDPALGAMIKKHGGWEGWSEAYTRANEFPDYLTWREQVFGIPSPSPAAQPPSSGLLGSEGQSSPEGLPKPKSREEVLALPPGTRFVTPDGRIGVRP
jgi:hypothetical protein